MTRAERRKRKLEPPKLNVGMGGYGNKEREAMKQTTALTDQQTKAAGQASVPAYAIQPIYTKHFMIVYDPGDKRETIPATYQIFRLTDLATAVNGETTPVYGWEELMDATEFAHRMDEVVEWAVRQEHLKAAIEAGIITPDFDPEAYTLAAGEE